MLGTAAVHELESVANERSFASLSPVTTDKRFRDSIPFIKDLGVEFLAAADGRSEIVLQLTPRHLNSWNVAHGGVIMSLLDVAMAVAGRTLDPNAAGGVTVEMKTSFVNPGNAGARLTARGHAFHRSTTMAFCEGEVRDERNRLIAKSMGTFKYIKRRDSATQAPDPGVKQ